MSFGVISVLGEFVPGMWRDYKSQEHYGLQ